MPLVVEEYSPIDETGKLDVSMGRNYKDVIVAVRTIQHYTFQSYCARWVLSFLVSGRRSVSVAG
jgi:hypothetical protein